MNKLTVLLCSLVSTLLVACSSSSEMKVTVENPSDFDRQNQMVEVPVESIKSKLALPEGKAYLVKDAQGNVVPSQLTSDQKLIFLTDLKSKESLAYTIIAAEPQKYEAKTFGRFVPERQDDFAWENDKVVFRVYGPALIATDGPSNGIDIWYKYTNALVIDKWYKDYVTGVSSYHEDTGQGLDDYKVGHTLGAGAMAPYVDNKLWLNSNFVTHEVLDNGPLRTTFKLTYTDLDVNGNKCSETREFSIDAGSQLTKVVETYGGLKEAMPVAAGFPKRELGDSLIFLAENNSMIYLEHSAKAGEVYLGLVFPMGLETQDQDTYKVMDEKTKKENEYTHFLGLTTYKVDTPLTYYTGYGWSKFGFPTIGDFQKYIVNFEKALKQPLVLKY